MSDSESGQSSGRKIPLRSSEAKRAWRIRRKPEDQRSDKDKAWFANYEATKLQARPREESTAEGATETAEDDAGDADTDDAGDIPVGVDTPAPAPPPPPRVGVRSSRDAEEEPASGDWKKKYTKGSKEGRERTVTLIASQWKSGLKMLSDQIRLSGIEPMVDVEALWPYLVITVDDMLPAKVTIRPQHIAAVGTTVILGQRWMRRKEINAAYERGASIPVEPVASPVPDAPVSVPDSAPDTAPTEPSPVPPAPPEPVEPPLKINVPTVDATYVPAPGEVF